MSSDKVILFLIEFFTGYLLQAVSFVLFVYAFNGKRIVWKKYFVTCAILMVFIFISRNMNISFGVHTIINLILLIVLTVFYCKMPINKCTAASFIVTLIMVVIEIMNIGLMMLIFTPDVFKVKVKEPLWNSISAIPATTGLFLVALIFYIIKMKRTAKNEKLD